MKNARKSIVYEKSFNFAIRIIDTYRGLTTNCKEHVLSKQLLRAGTSIGANIREGLEGQSSKDFVSKLSIALKESTETEYWIELLLAAGYLEEKLANSLLEEVREIIKILNAIIKTKKKNNSESC